MNGIRVFAFPSQLFTCYSWTTCQENQGCPRAMVQHDFSGEVSINWQKGVSKILFTRQPTSVFCINTRPSKNSSDLLHPFIHAMAFVCWSGFDLQCAFLLIILNLINTSAICPPFGPNIDQFAVDPLPNVDFPLPQSWAGLLRVPDTKNDQLFFWLFEAESEDQSKNLIIWLNGGPGCSSLDGLIKENGPIHFSGNNTAPSANPYSWTKLANVLYIDQPIGTGYSEGSNQPPLNAQVTQDFVGWLQTFYDVFPELKAKNTYIAGESYAGVYVSLWPQRSG